MRLEKQKNQNTNVIWKPTKKQLELYDKFMGQETAETKSQYWLVMQDFKNIHSRLITSDQTGKAIFSVLRHLKRIKMISGKTPKYALIV